MIWSTPAIPLGVPMTTRTSPGVQRLAGWRGGDHVVASDDGHDRRSGAGPCPCVTQRPAGIAGAGADLDLPGAEPGHLLRQVGEPLGDPGRAEDLGDRVGFLCGEPQQQPRLVGIPAVVGDHLEVALPTGHDPDAAALRGGELVAQPNTRQQHLIDVHPGHDGVTACRRPQ